MVIFGRDYNFLLTVGAAAEIADLCPNGDMERLPEALSGSYSTTVNTTAKLICAMSKGYELSKAFMEPGYDPRPLTVEIVLALPQKEFLSLQTEAVKAFTDSQKTEVEVESKKNEPEKVTR